MATAQAHIRTMWINSRFAGLSPRELWKNRFIAPPPPESPDTEVDAGEYQEEDEDDQRMRPETIAVELEDALSVR